MIKGLIINYSLIPWLHKTSPFRSLVTYEETNAAMREAHRKWKVTESVLEKENMQIQIADLDLESTANSKYLWMVEPESKIAEIALLSFQETKGDSSKKEELRKLKSEYGLSLITHYPTWNYCFALSEKTDSNK